MSTNPLGLMRIKVAALAVADAARAAKFYGQTLELPPASLSGDEIGFDLENTILMLKPQADWYGRPSAELNARLTLQVTNARETEKALLARGVTICDPVADYDGFPVGAFLDSEGNKLWFCSEP
jgi:catechol 2,3-dioxygenase-like lactoylglutathione lyase family enzyme